MILSPQLKQKHQSLEEYNAQCSRNTRIVRRSKILASSGEHKRALLKLKNAITINTRNSDLYERCATLLYNRGNYKEADDKYSRVSAIDPTNTQIYLNVGLCYIVRINGVRLRLSFKGFMRAIQNVRGLEKCVQALDLYRRAIKKWPYNWSFNMQCGVALYDKEEYEEAIVLYMKALECYGDKSYSYFSIEVALRHLKRSEEADLTHIEAMQSLKVNSNYMPLIKQIEEEIRILKRNNAFERTEAQNEHFRTKLAILCPLLDQLKNASAKA